jgi:cardiolipin synthase
MIHLIPTWVTILVVSRDLILMLGTAVAHFTDSRVDITPTFLGKGTTFLQLSYVVLVIFLSSRHIDPTVMLPLLFGMVSFTLLSGLHYLYRGYRSTSATIS